MAIAEIRIIVRENKLFKTLAVLDGLTLQPPVVVIANGVAGEPKKKSGLTAPEAVFNLIDSKKNGDVLGSMEIGQYVLSQGLNKSATFYGISKALKSGKLKKAGSMKYRVVK